MKKALLFVGLVLAIVGCSKQSEVLPDISKAQEYQILGAESYAAPADKGRYKVIIYSASAKTVDQRAQTAIKVAIDFQREKKAYEVLVWLEALPKVSERLAVADYYPFKVSSWGDEKEYAWSVEASDYEVAGYKVNSLDIIMKMYLRE